MPKTLHSTKHFHLVKQLRPLIAKMNPGDAIPTQQKLKKQFNVSQNTIELALSRLRREGLIERPAGKQRLVKSEICDPADHYIAIVRPDWPSSVIEGISQSIVDAGHAANWRFDITNYRSHMGLDLEKVIGDNDAAVLMLTTESVPDHLRDALTYTRKPIVLAQDVIADLPINSVCTDDGLSMQQAVEHLGELGHRRIGILLPTLSTAPMAQALEGYKRGMNQLGMHDHEALIVHCQNKPFTRSIDIAYPVFKQWFKDNQSNVTAMVCANMDMGMVVNRCVHEAGLSIPEQFSIVSSDNIAKMGEYFYPPATTTEMDISLYGKAVVELLQYQFDDELAQPQYRYIPSYLIKRKTSGPVPSLVPPQ
jgi:DNA-binding LacI/PurR family transcriptional regulator